VRTVGPTGDMGDSSDLTLKGEFGIFTKQSSFVWEEVEGLLVRNLANRARYIKLGDGALKIVPKGSRAINMGSKIIMVSTEASGWGGFAKTIASGKLIAKELKHSGKVFQIIDLGIGVKRVSYKWNTPERERTAALEAGKFGTGLLWGRVAVPVAHAICGSLTLTTGAGGAFASFWGEVGGDVVNSLTKPLFDKMGKLESVTGIPWLYRGTSRQLNI